MRSLQVPRRPTACLRIVRKRRDHIGGSPETRGRRSPGHGAAGVLPRRGKGKAELRRQSGAGARAGPPSVRVSRRLPLQEAAGETAINAALLRAAQQLLEGGDIVADRLAWRFVGKPMMRS